MLYIVEDLPDKCQLCPYSHWNEEFDCPVCHSSNGCPAEENK